MSGTIFSLIPPIVAIALALITKEVYLSLLIGIMSGAFLFTGPNPLHAVETMIAIMGEKIGGNVNILLFLAFLGIVVSQSLVRRRLMVSGRPTRSARRRARCLQPCSSEC